MSNATADLAVVAGLDKDTIFKICAAFDRVLMFGPRRADTLKSIAGLRLDDESAASVLAVLYNFAISKHDPDGMLKRIDSCDLDPDKKDMLKNMLREIHGKTDHGFGTCQASRMADLGHPHVLSMAIGSNFRPVFTGNKITKIVPSIVITGLARRAGPTGGVIPFSLQMGIDGAEDLVKNLQQWLQNSKDQMSIMRAKFGKDVIDSTYPIHEPPAGCDLANMAPLLGSVKRTPTDFESVFVPEMSDRAEIVRHTQAMLSNVAASRALQDWSSPVDVDPPEDCIDANPGDLNYDNRKAFEAFVVKHAKDPEFKDKYVAFVHGKYEGSDESMHSLICRMYDKFGNVAMYVDSVHPQDHQYLIATLPWP